VDGDVDIIRSLSGEQVAERAKALLLEAEYWQQVLADCTRVNDGVLEASRAVIETASTCLPLLRLVDPTALPLVEAIVEQQRLALTALKAIAETLDGTIELADGRYKALEPVASELRQAAGLEPDDDDQAVEQ
jgi:hypothetical protein